MSGGCDGAELHCEQLHILLEVLHAAAVDGGGGSHHGTVLMLNLLIAIEEISLNPPRNTYARSPSDLINSDLIHVLHRFTHQS